MLNHVAIMGRLTRDPELRETKTGNPAATFTVACDRDYTSGKDKETDFINCVAFKHTAEFISKYFRKGSMIIAIGSLRIRDYTDRDGNKRKATEVFVQNVEFGEAKRSESSAPASGDPLDRLVGQPGVTFSSAGKSNAFSPDDSDGELPF